MATDTTVRATKGIPSVPDVPPKIDIEGVYRILEPLTRIINIRQGKFDPLDRWVTQQDLVDIGVTTETAVSSPVVVVPPTSVYNFVLDGDIIGGPTTMANGQPTITMQTAIDLPNVVCIDGGDAAETYPGETTGPYGVAGGGGGGGVPDGGDAGEYLIKQSSTDGDAIWEAWGGVNAGAGGYCPGYTSYTRVDDDEFTVDLIDAENLFYVGRRLKFTSAGADVYGEVTAVDFDTTSANDTHITMSMEDSAVVPTVTFDVCLVSNSTQWSPIAADPFSGTPINAIATGVISGTQWWVIVGDAGRLATSTDGGASWTIRTTGTSENLNTVAYSVNNAEFFAGGNAGVFVYSTNGSSWTLDTTTIPALATTGNANITHCAFDEVENEWGLSYLTTSSTGAVAWTASLGGSWDGPNYQLNSSNFWNGKLMLFPWASYGNINVTNGLDDYGLISDYNDVSATSQISSFFSSYSGVCHGAGSFEVGVARNIAFSDPAGPISLYNGVTHLSTDDVLFVNGMNDFAHSVLHSRLVAVGESAQLGYIDDADQSTNDSWVSVSNGFDPLTIINAVAFNEVDGVFVAGAENGQICRSSNGTN